MFVSQSWTESRLNMPQDIFEKDDDYVILPTEFFDNLWQPDPYFLNSKVSGKHVSESKKFVILIFQDKLINNFLQKLRR